jgi:hypothetical protein
MRLDQFDHADFKSENRFKNFFSLLELEHVLKLHILMNKIFFLGIMKIIIFFHFIMKDGLKYAIKTFGSKKKFSNFAKF